MSQTTTATPPDYYHLGGFRYKHQVARSSAPAVPTADEVQAVESSTAALAGITEGTVTTIRWDWDVPNARWAVSVGVLLPAAVGTIKITGKVDL